MQWSFSKFKFRKERKESNLDIFVILYYKDKFDLRNENTIRDTIYIILSLENGRASYNIQIRTVIQILTLR